MTAQTPRPHYCNARAFDLFASAIDDLGSPGALVRAAVAVAMHHTPEFEVSDTTGRLDELADRIFKRTRTGQQRAFLAHAHEVLFDEEGFTGNRDNYYDPSNSFLPTVLETRRGIPITLTLVYCEVLRRIGVPASGVNAPGHFLGVVALDGRPMIVDPFTGGRVLSRMEAEELIRAITGRDFGDREVLPIATPTGWLFRILQNLQVIFERSGQMSSLAAMMELHSALAAVSDSESDARGEQ